MRINHRIIGKEISGRVNLTLLLLFLLGCCLGSLSCYFFRIDGALNEGFLSDFSYTSGFLVDPAVLLSCLRFLVPVFLLAFTKFGSALIPPWFGVEGFFLGAAGTAICLGSGIHGLWSFAILVFFRLLLLLPYGFLLGSWAIERSLRFDYGSSSFGYSIIGGLTLLIVFVTAFLECTLGRWLCGLYYFGV